MVTQNSKEYLQPSDLCDFDRHPEIRAKALEVTLGCRSKEDMFQRIFAFVKELPYGLEDWTVPASESLVKGWGMCSGKTNLLVAMLRSLGIPARYRVYRIKPNNRLQERASWDDEMKKRWEAAPDTRDHVDCEVWLGTWKAFDPGRDTPLERGMLALGISLERQIVTDTSGRASYIILSSFDSWARERQARRTFREDRGEVFSNLNERFDQMRAAGRGEGELIEG